MRLTRLDVQRLPGIDRPFTLEARPGMNVITGPNGVGKSSVARAVFRLLWPQRQGPLPFEVTASFVDGEKTWVVTSDHAGQVTWTVNDQVVPTPHLPSDQVAPSYRLGLLDLNLPEAGDDDLDLARQLRRQMDGGYDLAQVLQDLFPPSPQLGRQELRVWRQAREKVRELENRYQHLAHQERGLTDLEQQVQQARLARKRAEVYEALLAQASLKNRQAENLVRLDSFPPGQDVVLPDDPRQLKNLMREQQEAGQNRDRLQALALTQEAQLESGAWPPAFDPVQVADRLDMLIDKATSLSRDRQTLERELAGQEGERDGAPDLSPVDQQTYNDLLDVHDHLAQATAARDAAEETGRRLGSPRKQLFWWGLCLALTGLLLAVGGQLAWSRDMIAGWVISALGLGLTLFGGIVTGRRRGLKEEATRWDQERARRQEALAQVQARQEELGRRQGLDLNRPHLVFNLKLLDLKMEAQAAEQRLRREWTAAGAQVQDVVAQANQLLSPLGGESLASVEDLKTAAKRLARQQEARQQIEQARSTTAAELDFAQRELESVAAQIEAIATRLQLPVDATLVARAMQMVKDKPDWEGAQKAVQHHELKLATLDQFLEENDQILDLAAARRLDDRQWDQRRLEERELAEREDDLVEALAQLKSELNLARRADDLETADAQAEDARLNLITRREEARNQALGQLLLGEVRHLSEDRSRPAVLKEAQHLFHQFTRGQFDLVVRYDAEGQGRFLARDNERQSLLQLPQLSDGTRAQLLLAVRLGFIFQSESESRPPLFLDDSLAASDPVRFAAVATSLGRLAADRQRQVFFLTADPAEVRAWNRALELSDQPAAHLIDLGQLRLDQAAALPDALAPASPEPLPDPGRMTAAEYGQALQVPALDPWAAPSAAHLFYLLDDQREILHQVLTAGLPTVGRWENRPDRNAGLNEAQHALLEFRVKLWPQVVEAWRIGRAPRLTMETIDRSGAISSTMRPRVEPLLAESGGDARVFMDAVMAGQVARLGGDKKNLLQETLEQEGFLPANAPLDDDALLQQVRAQAPVRTPNQDVPAEELRRLVLRQVRFLDQATA